MSSLRSRRFRGRRGKIAIYSPSELPLTASITAEARIRQHPPASASIRQHPPPVLLPPSIAHCSSSSPPPPAPREHSKTPFCLALRLPPSLSLSLRDKVTRLKEADRVRRPTPGAICQPGIIRFSPPLNEINNAEMAVMAVSDGGRGWGGAKNNFQSDAEDSLLGPRALSSFIHHPAPPGSREGRKERSEWNQGARRRDAASHRSLSRYLVLAFPTAAARMRSRQLARTRANHSVLQERGFRFSESIAEPIPRRVSRAF